MSTPNPAPGIPKWLSRSIVTLLVVQVALLWTYGSLLQRQHDDIQALREDVQDLADSLDQDQDQDWDSNESEAQPHPARWAGHRHRPARAAYLQAPSDEADPALKDLKKDLDSTRQSEQDALAKARDVQEKLSYEENARKAELKARQEAAGKSRSPWLWAGAGAVAAALVLRAFYRRRG